MLKDLNQNKIDLEELNTKINNVFLSYKLLKFNRFYLINKDEDVYIYWIKYNKNGDIHSRTEYLNNNLSTKEIYNIIKYPKYQWTIINRARTMKKRPDWPHLNYIKLKENVEKLSNKYKLSKIRLNTIKEKGRERFYLSYLIYIDGIVYKKKTRNFKVTEYSLEELNKNIKKHKNFLIDNFVNK